MRCKSNRVLTMTKQKKEEVQGQPKKRSFLKKFFITVLVLILIIISAALFLALWTPTVGEKINTDENTKIYNALASQGLTEVIVDVLPESTLIVYSIPEKANEVGTLFFTVGTVYALNPSTPKLEIRAYNGEQYKEYIVTPEIVDKYDKEEITDEEFIKETMISKE